jgi:hypothetical protein
MRGDLRRSVRILQDAWGPTPTRSRSRAPLRGASLRPLARAAGAVFLDFLLQGQAITAS